MKIAISSAGTTLDSPVDLRFGRASYFVVCDVETGAATSADNSINMNAAQGAGIQAAKTVADLGVGAVITGQTGPKAFDTLQAAGIAVYSVSGGTVAEALALFQANALKAITSPNN